MLQRLWPCTGSFLASFERCEAASVVEGIMELLTWIQADHGLVGLRLVAFNGFVDHESFRAELCNWPKSPVSWTGQISTDNREHIAQESQAMALCPLPEVAPMVCQRQSSVFSAREQPTNSTPVYGLPAQRTKVTHTTGNADHQALSEAMVQVLDCMNFLDAMEDVQAATSFRVNCAYWILEDTFANFETFYLVKLSAEGVSSRYSRIFAKQIMAQLYSSADMQCYLQQSDHLASAKKRAMNQRLQRGRTFKLLSDMLCESIFLALPEVCVTRDNKLSLSELQHARLGIDGDSASGTSICLVREKLLPVTNG